MDSKSRPGSDRRPNPRQETIPDPGNQSHLSIANEARTSRPNPTAFYPRAAQQQAAGSRQQRVPRLVFIKDAVSPSPCRTHAAKKHTGQSSTARGGGRQGRRSEWPLLSRSRVLLASLLRLLLLSLAIATA
jgi:hypothetical protein